MIDLRTARLRLRLVNDDDREAVVAMGADERVMATLGGAMPGHASEKWLATRMEHWRAHDFGRFAVLREHACVGFVGLSRQDLDEGLLPAVDRVAARVRRVGPRLRARRPARWWPTASRASACARSWR